MSTNIAVIFAGGIGSRMNSKALPKQFLEIHGKPVIIHTLEHFENHPDIDAIAVALISGWHEHFRSLLRRFGLSGADLAADALAMTEERAAFQRFGA